jgi:hypothetical protein
VDYYKIAGAIAKAFFNFSGKTIFFIDSKNKLMLSMGLKK